MTDQEILKYCELLIAMSTDCLQSKITTDLFRSNISLINQNLNPHELIEAKISVLLDEAKEIESGAILTSKSIKAAWAGRMRGKASKLRDKLNAMNYE